MSSTLHFLRVRHKDSNDPFCDPEADIKVVFKCAVEAALHVLNTVYPEAVEVMKGNFAVFYTRLEEDTAPLDTQLEQFLEAMKLDEEVTRQFLVLVSLYCLVTFALYSRRDSKADKLDGNNIKVSAATVMLTRLLSKQLSAEVKKALAEHIIPITQKNAVKDLPVDAVSETKTIEDIKGLAASIFTEGELTWDEASAACDKLCETSNDDNQQIAAALAFPSYKLPTFTIKAEEE